MGRMNSYIRVIFYSTWRVAAKVTGQNASLMIAYVETLHCNVCAVARSVSRRAGSPDERKACDRRTMGALYDAQRVRDMREYPFWARSAGCIETVRSAAPRKILRDSPTRRDTPKKNC